MKTQVIDQTNPSKKPKNKPIQLSPCSALRARCYVAASGSVLIPWTCAVRRKDAIAKAQNATCKPWSHLRTVGWSMKAAILIEVG